MWFRLPQLGAFILHYGGGVTELLLICDSPVSRLPTDVPQRTQRFYSLMGEKFP